MLAVGSLFRREGFEYLIKAMPKVVKEFPDAKLHIVGSGPEKQSLVILSRKLDISGHIIFHGYVSRDELYRLYKMCRVLICSALLKGQGIAQLEAMASGRPVIATDTAGYRETIIDGRNGFLVPRADPSSIAEATCKLLNDYELCRKMGLEGRRLVEGKYDWRIIVKQYYKIYEEIAGR